MTHETWLRVCAKISRLWDQRDFSPESAESWYPYLADLDDAAVDQAVDVLALEREWPPSLADLREAAEPAERSPDDAARDLRKLIAQGGGAYRDTDTHGVPTSRDPALDAAVASVGWHTLCNLDMTSPSGWARFRDAYKSAQADLRRERRRAIAAGDVPPPEARPLALPSPPEPEDCPHERVAFDRVGRVCLDCDADLASEPPALDGVDPETAKKRLRQHFAALATAALDDATRPQ